MPTRYVLALGSLEPRKNLAGLIEAWTRLGPALGNVELVLAGRRRSTFRSAGVERLPARVRLLTAVADVDLPALYTGARAFAAVSFYEGFGLPPLEAMACGTPVVASVSGAIPEVVGPAGILVDPHDPDSIAAGLRAASGDGPLRADARGRGLERARGFSWEHTAEATWRVLAAAAAHPPASAASSADAFIDRSV